MKKISLLLFLVLTGYLTHAQILKPVTWSYSSKQLSNNKYELDFAAKLDNGWHIYSQFVDSNGPIPTSFTFQPSNDFVKIGKVIETGKLIKENDPAVGMILKYYENEVVFSQIIELKKPLADIKGSLEYEACNQSRCLPPADKDFEFRLPLASAVTKTDSSKPKTDTQKVVSTPVSNNNSDNNKQATVKPTFQTGQKTESLWITFLQGLLAGLTILVMPCTYPMIPLTVSYFTKHSQSRKQGIGNAFTYAGSILIIFISLGLFVTLIFGRNALNDFASNAFFNLLFFAVFVALAISLFGAFEIVLPSRWVNASEKMTDKGGLLGIFFMAFTLTLVSFSCTIPVIGGFLSLISNGSFLVPIVGMAGCGFMLGLPFGLLALFPQWMQSLPKSGGWLNAIKVSLGFIELGFAFIYLSKVDLAYHWDILPRDLFLTIWIVLAILLGIYLLGKIKLPHDTEVEHISVPRLLVAIVTFSFAVYLIPGLWGAPLNGISGFIPPIETQSFNLVSTSGNSSTSVVVADSLSKTKKYSNLFKGSNGINAYFDYDEGMAYARKIHKPVLLDFTGWSCVNCRKMEHSVWADKDVLQHLENDFVVIELYVDDKTALPDGEQYVSKSSGEKVNTIGKKNIDIETTRFNENAQPYYVPLNNAGELLNNPSGYNQDIVSYLQFLNSSLQNYKATSTVTN